MTTISKRMQKLLLLEVTIFELSAVVYVRKKENPCNFPWYKVNKEVLGYFNSLELAEKSLRAENRFNAEDVFCYFIRELAADIVDFGWPYRQITYTANKEKFVEVFNYGMAKKDGELGDDALGEIFGNKLKIGDLVYCLQGEDEVSLGIVSLIPYDEEEPEADDESSIDESLDDGDEFLWDDEDEGIDYRPSYTVLFGTGVCSHDHIQAVNVLPAPKSLPLPVSEMLREDLRIVQEFDKHYGQEGFKEYPELWEKIDD